MFHLTEGSLRRWSLWNEPTLPEFAFGEEIKYQAFQSFKNDFFDRSVSSYHPLAMFDHWPYWMVIDLCRAVFEAPSEYEQYLGEPESLLEVIVNYCDEKFSMHERGTPAQLFQ